MRPRDDRAARIIIGALCVFAAAYLAWSMGRGDLPAEPNYPRLVTTETVELLPPASWMAEEVVTTTTAEPTTTTSQSVTRSWTWGYLADCESGEWDRNGVPIRGTADWASTENGHEGGVHFAPSTWDGFRDADMPEAAYLASREVQIVVAERVLAEQGPGAWPKCSYKVGMR